MSNDTFTWTMTAFPHRTAINALRFEIREAHASGGAVSTALLLDLVPLSTAQAEYLLEREPFQFSGDKFSSEGDELRSEIYDPVLDVYYLTVPSTWSGTVAITGQIVVIVFDTPLQLEIPRLASLGVSRSKFQKLTKITGDPQRIISELIDDANGAKTLLDVHLVENATPFEAGLTGRMTAMASSPCSSSPEEPNWYVYERKNSHGVCTIHDGEYIYGGQEAYDYKFGPATYKACEEYVRKNCPLS